MEERPKMEDFGDYILIILKIPYHYDNRSNEIETEQISLVLGPNFVFSFQERVFASKGRKNGSDNL
jgi:magnesium transporter